MDDSKLGTFPLMSLWPDGTETHNKIKNLVISIHLIAWNYYYLSFEKGLQNILSFHTHTHADTWKYLETNTLLQVAQGPSKYCLCYFGSAVFFFRKENIC